MPPHDDPNRPHVDVAALTTLLDGRYKEVRDLARENLVRHADSSRRPRRSRPPSYRERVKDVVVELAGNRSDRLRLPQGVRRRRRRRRLGRGVRDLRLRRPLGAGQARGAVRAVRRRDPPARDRAAPQGVPRAADHRRGHGRLRDDRDRPRLQRAGDRHHGDVRPGDRRVRDQHAGRRCPQGLHRQRRDARALRRGVRPARGRRRAARRARARRAAARRGRDGARPACASRTAGARSGSTAWTTGGIWFDDVRVPRDALLNQYADVDRGRHLHLRDREPGPAVLHDARHARAGSRVRRRRRDQRRQGRPGDRRPLRRTAAAVRPAGRRDGDPAARLRPAPAAAAAAAGAHLRAALRPGARRRRPAPGVLRRRTAPRSAPAARWSHGPPRPRRWPPGTPPGPSRSAGRPAAEPATSRSTGSTRCAPTPTCSRPSRATTRSSCSWSPRAGSPTCATPSGRSTRSAPRATSPGSPSRRWWRRPPCASSSSGCATPYPGMSDGQDPDAGPARPGLPPVDAALARGPHDLRASAAGSGPASSGGGDPAEVFSRAQDHVIAAAWAHAERLVLEAFLTKVENMPDGIEPPGAQHGLRPLRAVDHRGRPGLVHGARPAVAARSKAVTAMVNELCRRLRPHAVDLVDAFGVPREMLRTDLF